MPSYNIHKAQLASEKTPICLLKTALKGISVLMQCVSFILMSHIYPRSEFIQTFFCVFLSWTRVQLWCMCTQTAPFLLLMAEQNWDRDSTLKWSRYDPF